MYQPTPRDLQVLTAYMLNGTCAKAAKDLGVKEQSVKQKLWLMRLKARLPTTELLIYEYRDQLRDFRLNNPGKAA